MTAPQRQGAAAVGTVAADAELAQLVGCPDRNGAEDLVTFFQLETRPTGGGWPSSVAARRTGWGWRCSCARCPGWGPVPDQLTAAPVAAVHRLADQLGLDPAVLAGYGGCGDRTRTEHLRQVLERLDWRPAPLVASPAGRGPAASARCESGPGTRRSRRARPGPAPTGQRGGAPRRPAPRSAGPGRDPNQGSVHSCNASPGRFAGLRRSTASHRRSVGFPAGRR